MLLYSGLRFLGAPIVASISVYNNVEMISAWRRWPREIIKIKNVSHHKYRIPFFATTHMQLLEAPPSPKLVRSFGSYEPRAHPDGFLVLVHYLRPLLERRHETFWQLSEVAQWLTCDLVAPVRSERIPGAWASTFRGMHMHHTVGKLDIRRGRALVLVFHLWVVVRKKVV